MYDYFTKYFCRKSNGDSNVSVYKWRLTKEQKFFQSFLKKLLFSIDKEFKQMYI